MEYKLRAKNRRLKRVIIQSAQLLKFKGFYLSTGGKITVFWVIVIVISLLSRWINTFWIDIPTNAFGKTAGSVGYTLLIICCFILFLTFSFHKKQKIKLGTDLNFRDYNAITFSWLITIILSIHSIMFISWFQAFSSSITYGNWPIISLIGWILFLVGWLMLKKETKNQNQSISINDINYDEKEQAIKENMKLPF